jgi:hypothetical protein
MASGPGTRRSTGVHTNRAANADLIATRFLQQLSLHRGIHKTAWHPARFRSGDSCGL